MSRERDDLIRTIWNDLYTQSSDLRTCEASISKVFVLLRNCFESGGSVFICGNGGSASDAEHIAGELVKPCALSRPVTDDFAAELRLRGDDGYLATHLARGLSITPLVSQAALLTAIANDQGGDLIFAQQVMAYVGPPDILWALSTSGSSRNVVLAARTARAKGAGVVSFTGPVSGPLGELSDEVVATPGSDTPHIQHYHQRVYHAVCLALEAHFYA